MTFPNLDNTFLSSLKPYRWLRGGKWYLRHYQTFHQLDSDAHEGWCRYGKKSPMSYVVKMEDYTPKPPFIAGLGGTLIDGKW